MFSKNIAAAAVAVLAFTASAAPASKRQDPCQDTYKECVAAGTPEVVCSCKLTACLGEDNARNREWCASATSGLAQPYPTPTSIPGGCNPAHPGSCPTDYPTTAVPEPGYTSIPGIPGGCNPAHPGSCPSSYFTTEVPEPTWTPIPGIPGGCNPAHPGSCPSNYFTYPVAPTATPAPGAGAPGYHDPKPVEGKTWSIEDMTRYCGEGNTGCDYNFAVNTGDKTQRCTVIRMPGANAATESWSNEPCTDGSDLRISWGYVAEPGPAFAVVTVNRGDELAWFGVANINEQEVTPSNPFGSGQYGNLGSEQVYTYSQ